MRWISTESCFTVFVLWNVRTIWRLKILRRNEGPCVGFWWVKLQMFLTDIFVLFTNIYVYIYILYTSNQSKLNKVIDLANRAVKFTCPRKVLQELKYSLTNNNYPKPFIDNIFKRSIHHDFNTKTKNNSSVSCPLHPKLLIRYSKNCRKTKPKFAYKQTHSSKTNFSKLKSKTTLNKMYYDIN